MKRPRTWEGHVCWWLVVAMLALCVSAGLRSPGHLPLFLACLLSTFLAAMNAEDAR